MQREEQTSDKVTSADALGLVYLIAHSHAAALTPFLRRGFGTEAFHPGGLFAFVAMVLLTQGSWRNGMGVYLAAWVVALIYRRIETFRLRARGVVVHSRFAGVPWLAAKFRFIKDTNQAKGFEPLLCLLAGAALCVVSQTLGFFVMAGFLSLGVCLCIEKFAVYRRVQQMQDAQIEGEFYAGQFKRGR